MEATEEDGCFVIEPGVEVANDSSPIVGGRRDEEEGVRESVTV